MNNRTSLIIILFTILLNSCNDDKKNSDNNTFYIQYSCKNDSLLKALKEATTGKITYYDNQKQLQIVSLNYVTEKHPNTHYLKLEEESTASPGLNAIKYEIRFNESMVNDSIAYSLKKYIYLKNGWQSKSEMGTIRVFDYLSEKDKKLRVIQRNVARSVVRTIAADTYSN